MTRKRAVHLQKAWLQEVRKETPTAFVPEHNDWARITTVGGHCIEGSSLKELIYHERNQRNGIAQSVQRVRKAGYTQDKVGMVLLTR